MQCRAAASFLRSPLAGLRAASFFRRPLASTGGMRAANFLQARTLVPPSRTFLHVPVLILAAKVGALAGAKKLALSALLRRVGVDNVIRNLRDANMKLRKASPELHSQAAFESVEVGLTRSEEALRTAQGSEQARRAFAWLESLEKNNPTFAAIVLRTGLDGLPAVKWANALLKPPEPPVK